MLIMYSTLTEIMLFFSIYVFYIKFMHFSLPLKMICSFIPMHVILYFLLSKSIMF